MKKILLFTLLSVITFATFASTPKKNVKKIVKKEIAKVNKASNLSQWYVWYKCGNVQINVCCFSSWSSATDYLMDHPATSVCSTLTPQ